MCEGFIADYERFDKVRQSVWVEGQLEWSAWTNGVKVSDKAQFSVTTFRCTRCGYLESYGLKVAN
jgi:hypothetical protein